MTRPSIREIVRSVDEILGPMPPEDRPRNVHKFAFSRGSTGLPCWTARLHRMPTASATDMPPQVGISYEWTPPGNVASGW